MRLYQITLGKEKSPTNIDKKLKWDNKDEKSCGLIRISISNDLWFHPQEIDALNVAWENLETIFWKHNEIWGPHLEN